VSGVIKVKRSKKDQQPIGERRHQGEEKLKNISNRTVLVRLAAREV
jgi:hypothetical protein